LIFGVEVHEGYVGVGVAEGALLDNSVISSISVQWPTEIHGYETHLVVTVKSVMKQKVDGSSLAD
jgi:hypothetical protein